MRAALRPPITYQYGDFVRALFAPPRARLGFLDLSGNSISGHVGTCLLPRASHMSSRSSVGGVPAIWAGDSALLEPRHLAHRSRVTLYAVIMSTGVCNFCARCRLLNPGRVEVCASRRRDLDVLPCAETERRARLPKCCGSAYRRLPCACLRRSGYDVVQWIRRGLVDFKTLMIMYFKSEFEPRRQYTRSTSTATSCQGHGLTAAASAPLASLLPSHYSYLCLGRGLSDRALRFPLQTARRDPNGHHRVVHCACTTTTAQSRYTKFARVITANNSVRLDDVSRGRYV